MSYRHLSDISTAPARGAWRTAYRHGMRIGRRIRCALVSPGECDRTSKTKKAPRLKLSFQSGRRYWRRPTFAQPIEALSSGLQRFTSVFGMGTGGSTALGSPEGRLLLSESTVNVDRLTSTGDSGYHTGVPSREPFGLAI